MSAGDALKVVHEHHVDRRAAGRAGQRNGARGDLLRDHDAKARGDLAGQRRHRRRRQVGRAALEQQRDASSASRPSIAREA